jgi:hypothetical protein
MIRLNGSDLRSPCLTGAVGWFSELVQGAVAVTAASLACW